MKQNKLNKEKLSKTSSQTHVKSNEKWQLVDLMEGNGRRNKDAENLPINEPELRASPHFYLLKSSRWCRWPSTHDQLPRIAKLNRFISKVGWIYSLAESSKEILPWAFLSPHHFGSFTKLWWISDLIGGVRSNHLSVNERWKANIVIKYNYNCSDFWVRNEFGFQPIPVIVSNHVMFHTRKYFSQFNSRFNATSNMPCQQHHLSPFFPSSTKQATLHTPQLKLARPKWICVVLGRWIAGWIVCW